MVLSWRITIWSFTTFVDIMTDRVLIRTWYLGIRIKRGTKIMVWDFNFKSKNSSEMGSWYRQCCAVLLSRTQGVDVTQTRGNTRSYCKYHKTSNTSRTKSKKLKCFSPRLAVLSLPNPLKSGVKRRHRSCTTLAQAMACCLTVPNYYLTSNWWGSAAFICQQFHSQYLSYHSE